MNKKPAKPAKPMKVSASQQSMIDAISETFGKLGCNSIQFGAKGKTFIDVKKKKLMKKNNA